MNTLALSIIVAVAENNVIGRDNDLLWRIPADFKHFKSTTMGKPMIMGRRTFESLPGLLPGRPHIVISRSGFSHEGVTTCTSLESAIEEAKKLNNEEIFIIGGAQIYAQAVPLCNRIYLTRVHRAYEGDAFFPEINMDEWESVSEEWHEGDPAFTIHILNRRHI